MEIAAENGIIAVIGVLLVLAAYCAKTISYGMPGRHKPGYGITGAQRVVLFVFGVLFGTLGILGLALGRRMLH